MHYLINEKEFLYYFNHPDFDKIPIPRNLLQEILKEFPFKTCILQKVWAEYLSKHLELEIPYGRGNIVTHPKDIKITGKEQFIVVSYKGPPLLEPILPIESTLKFFHVIF